jgi:hypothetical protein
MKKLLFYEEGTPLFYIKPDTNRYFFYFLFLCIWSSCIAFLTGIVDYFPESRWQGIIFNIIIDYPFIYLIIALYFSYGLLYNYIRNHYTIQAIIEEDILYFKRKNGLITHYFWFSWFSFYEIDNTMISSFKTFESYFNKKKKKNMNQISLSFTTSFVLEHDLCKNIQNGQVFINPIYSMHKETILDYLNEHFSVKHNINNSSSTIQ